MRWYGFVLIFFVTVSFCNFLYTVRLSYTAKNALIVKNFPLPEGSLEILDRPEKLLSAETMPKQPLLLFFLASWCRPCLMEAPVIAKLAKRRDVPFIGIAVRDNPEKLRQFLKKTNNPYQFVALDPKTEWTAAMRADRLPTAFVLNKKGEVAAEINGFLTEDFYFQTILPFLQELENEKPL
ncbi:MAG: redoxin family protein [Alphaproteobacteria bacterium]|nr:redoxin family protein [Alphaproteobacteria bacterium]